MNAVSSPKDNNIDEDLVSGVSDSLYVHGPSDFERSLDAWENWRFNRGPCALSQSPKWLRVLRNAFGHQAYCIEAKSNRQIVGILPLCFVSGPFFGRFLAGLPYLNSGGVVADSTEVARTMIDRAVELARKLDVKHLELRHESEIQHEDLSAKSTSKVHMRLALPSDSQELWKSFKPAVRNQVRKGEKGEVELLWGGMERLDEFYSVFSQNMRDLGTPVYSKSLFSEIIREFAGRAEFCVIRLGPAPIASALLLHGNGITEVPSASSLRQHNATNANMFMYWHLLCRAIERGQSTFDFGRSSADSGTYRFKKQWGAEPHPAIWQYFVRKGKIDDVRPENKKFSLAIRCWQRLPLVIANLVGPRIVRGIP